MKETIEKIVHYATMAPSPFNAQPWKFTFQGSELDVYIEPGRLDRGIVTDLNHKEQYYSLGAAIENIRIAARHYGYDASISYLPDSKETQHIAKIQFTISQTKESNDERALFDAIDKRWTNRNPMNGKTLSQEIIQEFMASVNEENDFKLYFTNKRNDIAHIAELAGIGERMKWEIKTVQKKEYLWMRFSSKQLIDGVPVWHFGYSKKLAPFMKIVLQWPLVSFLNLFGFSRYIGAASRKRKALKAPCIITLTAANDTVTDWVTGGQLYQRLLLLAAKNSVTIQPLSCVHEWIDVERNNWADKISVKHQKMLPLYRALPQKLSIPKEEWITAIFAAGYARGEKPPEFIRIPVQQVLEIK